MSDAVLSLIIFAVVVVLFIWNKLATSTVALLGLVAMLLTNIVSFSDGFKNFGGSTVLLICAMMVVGQAAFNTGLAQFVGNKVIQLARGNERLVIMLSTAITAIISAFLSNIATLAIMISILTGIASSNKKVRFKNVIMPVSMAAVLGGSATLIGSTTQLTANGLLEEFLGGKGFSLFTFSVPGFLIILLLVLYVGFIGYPLGKKIWGRDEGYDFVPVSKNEEKEPVYNKGKMILMAVIFLATMVLFVLADVIKEVIPAFNVGVVALISALACVLTGCITHKDALKSINWNLAIWFCACLGIAAGLNSSGGGEMLANWFVGLFGENISAFGLFAVFMVLVTVLTQFLSNSTVLTIVLPIVFSITEGLGYNTFSFAVGLTIAAAMAVATPLANTTIGMSMVANYKFSDYFKYAGPITLINTIFLLAIIPLLFPLV
ncbi:MAG: SLC13/DASS family transporter [Oscillospiraceae bacterium]|nr:SLC13/DASS family transporter [Oscillospiraceae bacterium]